MAKTKVIRIGVVGLRFFNDVEYFNSKLDELVAKMDLGGSTQVIFVSGHASGIDAMVEDYVDVHHKDKSNYSLEIKEADWDEHGKAAGFIRNQEIVDCSHRIIAFWDKESTGTKDTIDKAIAAGKHVKIVRIVKSKQRYWSQRHRAEFAKRDKNEG